MAEPPRGAEPLWRTPPGRLAPPHVYRMASALGAELRRLSGRFGPDAVAGLVPPVVRLLELLEALVAPVTPAGSEGEGQQDAEVSVDGVPGGKRWPVPPRPLPGGTRPGALWPSSGEVLTPLLCPRGQVAAWPGPFSSVGPLRGGRCPCRNPLGDAAVPSGSAHTHPAVSCPPAPWGGPDPAVPVPQDLEQRLWEAERRERALHGRLAHLEEQNQQLLGQLAESQSQEGGCPCGLGVALPPPTVIVGAPVLPESVSGGWCEPQDPSIP